MGCVRWCYRPCCQHTKRTQHAMGRDCKRLAMQTDGQKVWNLPKNPSVGIRLPCNSRTRIMERKQLVYVSWLFLEQDIKLYKLLPVLFVFVIDSDFVDYWKRNISRSDAPSVLICDIDKSFFETQYRGRSTRGFLLGQELEIHG